MYVCHVYINTQGGQKRVSHIPELESQSIEQPNELTRVSLIHTCILYIHIILYTQTDRHTHSTHTGTLKKTCTVALYA